MKKTAMIAAVIALAQIGCVFTIIKMVRRSKDHDKMVEMVKAARAKGDRALGKNNAKGAVAHYNQALTALLKFHYKHNYRRAYVRRVRGRVRMVSDLDNVRTLVAKNDEVVGVLTRLVHAYRRLGEPALAAGVANLLPQDQQQAALAKLRFSDTTIEQVRTAPSRFLHQLVSWGGEVTAARYDRAADRLWLEVTPISYSRQQKGWTRRNVVGPGGSRWETIPQWVWVKRLKRGKTFVAEIRGYDPQLVRGRYVRIFGIVKASSTPARIVLTAARPTKVLVRPKAGLVSLFGLSCRKPWSARCTL